MVPLFHSLDLLLYSGERFVFPVMSSVFGENQVTVGYSFGNHRHIGKTEQAAWEREWRTRGDHREVEGS